MQIDLVVVLTHCYAPCSYKFALQCFFGGVECGYQPGVIGTSFIVLYVVSYLGGGLLLRYSEGATYLAIVQVIILRTTVQLQDVLSNNYQFLFHH